MVNVKLFEGVLHRAILWKIRNRYFEKYKKLTYLKYSRVKIKSDRVDSAEQNIT